MAEWLSERRLDLTGLKALAHPLRQRMLYHLAFVGPANSTSIAEALSQNTGTTSYHLRKLADAGLIEELAERSNGRERWWRLVPSDLRGAEPTVAATAEGQLAEKQIQAMWRAREASLIRRYLAEQERFGDWNDAALFSNAAAHLTREEFAAFTQRYVELLKEYVRPAEDAMPGAIPVAVLFYAFPWPGEDNADELP